MAKGKTGLWIEGWKFSVYMAMPLLASWYYNDPARQKQSVDYWKYVQYPANPNTDMRKQIQEMQKQKEQREAYRQQMMELNQRAQQSREQQEQQQRAAEEQQKSSSWWRSIFSSSNKKSENQA